MTALATIAIACIAASVVVDVLFAAYRFLVSETLWLSIFVLCLTGFCTTFLAVLYLGFDSADEALDLALWVLGAGALLSAILIARGLGRPVENERSTRLKRP